MELARLSSPCKTLYLERRIRNLEQSAIINKSRCTIVRPKGNLGECERTVSMSSHIKKQKAVSRDANTLKHVERNLFGKSRSDPLFTGSMASDQAVAAQRYMVVCPSPPLPFTQGVHERMKKFIDLGSRLQAHSHEHSHRQAQSIAPDLGLCPSPPMPFTKNVGDKVQKFLDNAACSPASSHNEGTQIKHETLRRTVQIKSNPALFSAVEHAPYKSNQDAHARRIGSARSIQQQRARSASSLSLAGRAAIPTAKALA